MWNGPRFFAIQPSRERKISWSRAGAAPRKAPPSRARRARRRRWRAGGCGSPRCADAAPPHRDHRFDPQALRRGKVLPRKVLRVEHHLEHSLAVPQVDEDDAAHAALVLRPASQPTGTALPNENFSAGDSGDGPPFSGRKVALTTIFPPDIMGGKERKRFRAQRPESGGPNSPE